MFIIEKLIAIVAPHYCMICGDEGAIVCAWCLLDFAALLPERCYACKAESKDSAVCRSCRRSRLMRHVWARAQYEGSVKQLIHDFKFERKLAAAEPIAQLMAESLPFLSAEVFVVHVPTATNRVRKRGYDHAEKVAQALSVRLSLRHETFLARTTQTRQVGAKRTQRFSQMQNAFRPLHSERFRGATILLVDDLTTTGATLEAAAKCLKVAGAKTVDAVVFAQR